jgi:hypothetical protein
MTGYSFSVTMTLTNPSDTEQIVSIPRGTIIEPESTHLTFQSAVIAKDYVFRLNPKETRSVILDSECWNRHLAPPRGTPGKLTPLKGNIQKTTNVWNVSSSPVSKTLSIKPSQDAHIFAAFANTSPVFAHEFLNGAVNRAASDGIDTSIANKELSAISHPISSKDIDKLCQIARDARLAAYIGSDKVREFFIRQGRPTEDHVDAVERLVTNIYSRTSHRLAARLYDVAMELAELSEDRRISVTDERQEELTQLIRQKYMTLLDSLPLLDEIEW